MHWILLIYRRGLPQLELEWLKSCGLELNANLADIHLATGSKLNWEDGRILPGRKSEDPGTGPELAGSREHLRMTL